MALMNCPNCRQEISDKAKKCIHCGFEFEVTVKEPKKIFCTECGEELPEGANVCYKCGCPVMSEEEKEQELLKKKKRHNKKIGIAAAVVGLCCIAAVVVIGVVNKTNYYNNYVNNLESASDLMLDGAAEAEDLTGLTSRVWSDAIYEESDDTTRKYVRPTGVYVDDFNTALMLLYTDDPTEEQVSEIESGQEKVEQIMRELQNPPEGLEECYSTVGELYDAYVVLTGLAVNPTGSLTTFNSSVNSAVSDFSTAYKKLESQIPNQ